MPKHTNPLTNLNSPPTTENNQLRQIRCSSCGRFLGLSNIKEGEAYLLCKNCKMWTVVLGGKAEKDLTGQEMYDRISSVGQKARKVQ